VPQKAFWHKLALFVMTILFLVAFGVVLGGLVIQIGKVGTEFDRLVREKALEEGVVAPEPEPSLVPLTE